MISWTCRLCGCTAESEDRLSGRSVDCPNCKALVTVPTLDGKKESRTRLSFRMTAVHGLLAGLVVGLLGGVIFGGAGGYVLGKRAAVSSTGTVERVDGQTLSNPGSVPSPKKSIHGEALSAPAKAGSSI